MNVLRWLSAHGSMKAERIPLDELTGWRRDRGTGNLVHTSGKFFSVEGVDVHHPEGPVSRWAQPIINQPEVGVLGILMRRLDGVPHLLLQAKHEPGNVNGAQLSPTVQATRSNYTRVHGGRPVPYLDRFRSPDGRVLSDVRQSEQGSWFYRKRNRNMVIEIADDLAPSPGFRWLALDDVLDLLSVPDVVNMDTRTVLSCLPPSVWGDDHAMPGRSRHDMGEILSWITQRRSTIEIHVERIPLDRVGGWRREHGTISHETGRYFAVMGVSVTASDREVGAWTQPMIEPTAPGVVAFLLNWFDGVPHVLVRARVEPGYADVAELGPTVQCAPANHDTPPPFLEEVLGTPPGRVLFDTMLSEEGGRFYHARNRYLIVETDADHAHPDFRWVSLPQLTELLRHSHYLNVQARTLIACLYSVVREMAAAR
ncbi:NDP-hexose 2,3-dehydratase family protein [Nonomuraea sp. NPDC049400]|uniref:NDP-hexose 2,3-dehydratase family protein n=1 Tax=Nonomuraea sp. NPDC049400 TaxID=3364352 RepID=UPI0037932626